MRFVLINPAMHSHPTAEFGFRMLDVILSTLSGDTATERVVLIHRKSFGGQTVILRRESYSDDVGWFEQSSIELSPGQVGQLKQAIGVLPMSRVQSPASPAAGCPAGGCVADCDAGSAVCLSMVSQNVG